MRNDIGIVVRDRIDVIDPRVCWVINVFVRFASSKEPPSAIEVVVGPLTVHESDGHAVDSDHVCCKASAKTARERPNVAGHLGKPLLHGIPSDWMGSVVKPQWPSRDDVRLRPWTLRVRTARHRASPTTSGSPPQTVVATAPTARQIGASNRLGRGTEQIGGGSKEVFGGC